MAHSVYQYIAVVIYYIKYTTTNNNCRIGG